MSTTPASSAAPASPDPTTDQPISLDTVMRRVLEQLDQTVRDSSLFAGRARELAEAYEALACTKARCGAQPNMKRLRNIRAVLENFKHDTGEAVAYILGEVLDELTADGAAASPLPPLQLNQQRLELIRDRLDQQVRSPAGAIGVLHRNSPDVLGEALRALLNELIAAGGGR